MILTIFIPKYFVNLVVNVVKARENEEEVAQAVDETQYIGVYVCDVGEAYDAALAAAAYGAAYVGHCRAAASAGKYEVGERGYFGVEAVNLVFEAGYGFVAEAETFGHVVFGVVGCEI